MGQGAAAAQRSATAPRGSRFCSGAGSAAPGAGFPTKAGDLSRHPLRRERTHAAAPWLALPKRQCMRSAAIELRPHVRRQGPWVRFSVLKKKQWSSGDGGIRCAANVRRPLALIRQIGVQDDIARTRIAAGPPLFSKINEACDNVRTSVKSPRAPRGAPAALGPVRAL